MNGQKIINPGHTKLTLLQDGQSASRSIALRNRRFASYLLLSRLRTHNQNMTVAASAIADRNTFGHLS
jgi:hypothetical protein